MCFPGIYNGSKLQALQFNTHAGAHKQVSVTTPAMIL